MAIMLARFILNNCLRNHPVAHTIPRRGKKDWRRRSLVVTMKFVRRSCLFGHESVSAGNTCRQLNLPNWCNLSIIIFSEVKTFTKRAFQKPDGKPAPGKCKGIRSFVPGRRAVDLKDGDGKVYNLY